MSNPLQEERVPVSGLDELQENLGYQFKDPALLQLALTHPSVSHELGARTPHNQRLEFLGDAVLQLALTGELFDTFPDHDEGPLTKARALLVNQNSLARRSHQLELGIHLVLSRGEQANQGRERPSILADAYEAVLGAVYLDGGFEAVRSAFGDDLAKALSEADQAIDFKTELQEYCDGMQMIMVQLDLVNILIKHCKN